MPDDKLEEVTEQVAETDEVAEVTTDGIATEVITEVPDSEENRKEAESGFNDDEEEKTSGPEKEVKEEKEEPPEKTGETAEAKEVEEEKAGEEKEADEDEAQGAKIIEDEEKREKEALKADEAEQNRLETEAATKEAAAEAAKPVKAYNNDDITLFHNVVSDDLFPDQVKIGDKEFDVRGYLTDNPEVKTIASVVAKGMIDRLINTNFLPSFKGMEAKIQAKVDTLEETITNRIFLDKVLDSIPKAVEIYKSEKFNKWLPGQPEKIQALFRSDNAADQVRGFKRFQKAAGLAKAGKTVADLDKKREEAKAKVDSIYKTTTRSKATAKKTGDAGGLSPREQAEDGFSSSDEEEKRS